MRQPAVILLASLLVGAVVLTGCQKPLALDNSFDQITVGQSSVSEVLTKLPSEGMMHTASSVSVYESNEQRRGLGIVRFNQQDSTAERTHYIRTQLDKWLYFGEEHLLMKAKAAVSAELLDKPYEKELDKYEAILRYFHDGLVEDAQPFVQDSGTESLTGFGRALLGIGILALTENPRKVSQLADDRGFDYKHPNYGQCKMYLKETGERLYELTVTSNKVVDPFMRY